ncbi:MAG: hypothetical protein J6V40_03045, partial [Clostridia bacterium]|nr:hypothetical protein [Clostridia bacterium]
TYADQLSNQLYSQPTYDPQQYEDEYTYMINMYDDAVAGTYYTTCTPVAYMISIYYDDVEVQVDANQTLYDQGYYPAYTSNIGPDGETPMDYSSDLPQSLMSYYSYFTPVFYCPNCGTELNYMPDSINPCSNCGYPLLYTCPNCSTPLEYEPDASMPCPNCNYPLLYTCPNCSYPLEYEPDADNPCPSCGYPNNE